MKELELDALLKEKREEPETVPISHVNSWLKGGVAFVGLVAVVKTLLTKKKWIMLSSISSTTLIALLAIVQLNSSSKVSENSSQTKKIQAIAQQIIQNTEKKESFNQKTTSKVYKPFYPYEIKLNPKPTEELYTLSTKGSIEPIEFLTKAMVNDNSYSNQFTRIEADGFVHFTLVKGSSCSIKNSIPSEEEVTGLDYSIKNGTLYLKSETENNARDLIITVNDLKKIKLNGFCEILTSSTFESSDLEIELNGFTILNIDLNVVDLEIDMNGETNGSLNIKGKYLDFESTGFTNVAMECDFEQSRIEVTGFSKVKFMGTSKQTIMTVNGESKISAEEFGSQELFLLVSGSNQKLETAVSSKLDVEISGDNTVVIIGSPNITGQKVSKDSKLKFK